VANRNNSLKMTQGEKPLRFFQSRFLWKICRSRAGVTVIQPRQNSFYSITAESRARRKWGETTLCVWGFSLLQQSIRIVSFWF
jgi:hypothetical protein